MAVAFVRGKQTGSGAASELGIVEPTASNMLVVFITKSTEPDAAPKASDDKDGETGWTVNATKAKGNASAGSTWLATKKAKGGGTGEKTIKATGGTIQGLAVLEVSGSSEVIDVITATDNPGLSKTNTTGSYTSTDAGDFLVVGVGACQGGSSGAIEPWAGTGPVLTSVETSTTRCWAGWIVPGEVISGKTFSTKHVTERNPGMLVVTFKPAGAKANTKELEQATLGYSGSEIRASGIIVPSSALAFAGSEIKGVANVLPLSQLSFTGAMERATRKTLSAVVSYTGAVTRATVHRLVGASQGFTGSLTSTHIYFRILETAALGFTGAIKTAKGKLFPATLSYTSALGKSPTQLLSAAVSYTSATMKRTTRALATEALAFTGSARRGVSKALLGVVSYTGAVRRAPIKVLIASLSPEGLLVRIVLRSLESVLSFTGALTPQALQVLRRTFAAVVSFTGSTRRRTARFLTGLLSFLGPGPVPVEQEVTFATTEPDETVPSLVLAEPVSTSEPKE